MNNTPAITDRNSKHTFAVEYAPNKEVRVDANNRTQAAARAKKAGYTVRSVNMLG